MKKRKFKLPTNWKGIKYGMKELFQELKDNIHIWVILISPLIIFSISRDIKFMIPIFISFILFVLTVAFYIKDEFKSR
jgi:hypothetical protein